MQSSPEEAPLQVISCSKRSEKPSPVFNFSSRPSMNWGVGQRVRESGYPKHLNARTGDPLALKT